ncbi:MAG TPA: amino acid carrier protein, partial [bacterium]|nr:amino acid carrier protein [bacterium]
IISAFVLIGGIKSIGKVTSFLVPVMIGFYVICSLLIIFMNFEMVPAAFELIFVQAFTPTAAAGGFLGSTIMLTIRMGVARGVFSNESGLGSSPIAAAAAQTKHPAYQALISMTQTFIDTIIVCTMTGLVIVMSGLWSSGQNGAELTANAFSWGISGGNIVVAIGLILFAYSTILGWCYYGEKAIEYLFGERSIKPYRYVFILFVGVGAISKLEFVWSVSDTFNGLMALPNLIALVLLSPVVAKETKDFLKNHK